MLYLCSSQKVGLSICLLLLIIQILICFYILNRESIIINNVVCESEFNFFNTIFKV